MYWSDWGESPNIERAALDGSQRKIIVSHDLGFPNGITIDYKDRRLYWTDALKDRIDTSDLNGQHRVQLVPEAKNPFGMTQVPVILYILFYKLRIKDNNRYNTIISILKCQVHGIHIFLSV